MMTFNLWANELDFQIGNPHFAWLMVFALVAVVVSILGSTLRQRAVKAFGTTIVESGSGSSLSRFVSMLMVAMSIVFLSLALMDIRWGKTTYEVPQKGLEVVFALDVSRSMLAEDVSPNRLARAKQQIKDMVDEMAGDRVGLVVFAGEANQAVPLTSHYEDFKQVLDSVGPQSISVGGSQLGVALKVAAEAFISKTNEHKSVVLITDGEDQESEPVKLARRLHADEGIRVFTIGLGDMDQGARIPDQQSQSQSFVQHEGQQVWSKLNGRILNEIATETEAAYIPAGTKRVNMADVYHGYVANVEQTEFETAKINAYVARFQWFAGAALFCLLIEFWLMHGVRKKRAQSSPSNSSSEVDAVSDDAGSAPSLAGSKKVAAVIAFLLSVPAIGWTQEVSVARQINQANELVRREKTTEAIDAYNEIDSIADGKTKSRLDYNLAVAHYRNSDYPAAKSLFGESAKSLDRTIAASSRHNLGNCHYAIALPLVESQPDAAVEQLEEAIVHYRSALRLDRSSSDSRSNIELARKLIRQIQDQKKEEEQQENQDQSNESKQDQQQQGDQQEERRGEEESQEQQNKNQNGDPSENESDDSQDSREEANTTEGDEGSHSQSGEQGDSSETPGDSDRQPDASNNNSKQNTETGESQSEESNSDNRNQSASSSDASGPRGRPDDPQEGQAESPAESESQQRSPDKVTGELTSQSQDGEENRSAKPVAIQKGDDTGLMTREEALKLLQAVRDRDMLRRLNQQRRQRSRRVPVEKDW